MRSHKLPTALRNRHAHMVLLDLLMLLHLRISNECLVMSDSSHPSSAVSKHRGRGERKEGTGWRERGRGQESSTGRGSRGYRGRGSSFGERPDPTSQWQTQGALLGTVNIGSIPTTPKHLTVNGVEYIASYNWLDQKTSTFLVPGRFWNPSQCALLMTAGSPPVWAPLSTPRSLKQDSGNVYRDKNAAQYSKHPFEPAVRAIFTMQPQLQFENIDVVACGSTMGNLLRFARSIEMSFRFDVEFIGNSAFFVRKENHTKETIEGLKGYGHTFPEAYTNWKADVKGSVSHQRIIRYTFDGLTYLIRTESDGWLPERLKSEELPSAKDDAGLKNTDDDITSLIEAAESVSVSQKTAANDDALEMQLGGRKIPQKAIFDLKTRSASRMIDMADILPRLWVSQTPNFIIGYHKFGLFEDVQVRAVHEEIQTWQENNQDPLNRLSAVIYRIIEIAKSCEGQGIEVSRFGSGDLQIRKLHDGNWHALPSDLSRKWAGVSDKDLGSTST